MTMFPTLVFLLMATASGDGSPPQSAPVPVAPPPLIVVPLPPPPSLLRAATPTKNPGTWVTENDYPTAALREEVEGTTTFRLAISAAGMPTDCTIIVSSGNVALDQATCDTLLKRARFSPARDADDRPTTGSYTNRVRWVMPNLAEAPTPAQLVRSYDIEPGGAMSNCKIDSVTGSADEVKPGPIRCGDFVQFDLPVDAAGRPVRKHVIEVSEVRVEESDGSLFAPAEEQEIIGRALGISVAPMDAQFAREMGVSAETKGLVITEIDGTSNAAILGLGRHVIILAVNSKAVFTRAGMADAIRAAQAAKRAVILLQVLEPGRKPVLVPVRLR